VAISFGVRTTRSSFASLANMSSITIQTCSEAMMSFAN
jgi:hypothetical protein